MTDMDKFEKIMFGLSLFGIVTFVSLATVYAFTRSLLDGAFVFSVGMGFIPVLFAIYRKL